MPAGTQKLTSNLTDIHVASLASKTVVIEFHDPSHELIQDFASRFGLTYKGIVGPLEWAHEFEWKEEVNKRSALRWDDVIVGLQNSRSYEANLTGMLPLLSTTPVTKASCWNLYFYSW